MKASGCRNAREIRLQEIIDELAQLTKRKAA
jgi:hypothetical protein